MNKPISHSSLKWNPCFQIALVFALTCTGLLAAPYFGEEAFTYRQPDDEAFEVRIYGDEFFAYQETVDGYLVIRDPNNGFFCYANVIPDGTDIVSTGVRVGQPKPAGLKPKQRLGQGKAMVKSAANRNLLGVDEKGRRNPGKTLKIGKNSEILNVASDEPVIQSAPGEGSTTESTPIAQPAPPAAPTPNQLVGLVLLASFPDLPGDVTKTVSDIDNYCNAETYTADGNSTSVYGYFKIQSNGRLTYKNTVTAWFTAANPRSYYTDQSITYSVRAKELIREGLATLKAQGFDFTQCDANNDGKIDAVNCFYAGSAVNAWGTGLWPHKSNAIWNDFAGTGITDTVFNYQITDMPSSLALATFCHENGHMICDFPDLYSYDGNAAQPGDYSLMAAGGAIGRPRNIDPYLKIHAGWADVVELTSTSQQRCAVQIDRNFIYRYKNPARPTEYFLFEARGPYGYEGSSGGVSAINPGNGLVVYHALDTGSNGNSTIFTADTVTNYTTPYELMLVEASPTTTVTPWYDDPSPDTNDAFSASGVSNVSDSTFPELKFWASNGRTVASGANINTISAAGATMTFTVGSGSLPATPATAVTTNMIEQDTDFGDTAASQNFTVFNGAGGTLSYTISDDVTWLSCSAASGTATTEADVITVSYTTAALAVGTHTGTITVNGGSAGIQTIAVTLTVNPQPTIATSVASISLAGVAGSSLLKTTFQISNTGGGTVGYTLNKTQPWLSFDRTSGTVATEHDLITVTLDATTLAQGVYTDTITITSAEATNSSLTIPVTFTITGANMIVAAPNGTEKWSRGSTLTIAWSSGIGGNVKIELLKNGVLNTLFSSSTPNDGSFVWLVPADQPLGTNYRIRISSVETPAATDLSNADFSIALPPIYTANMDTDPVWTMQGAWAWGTPAGLGGDPSSGYTGSNVMGFNLGGTYANGLPETHVTTKAIDCSNRSNVTLSFYRWLGIEAGNFDKAYMCVSNDGVSWSYLFAHSNSSRPTMQDTAWALQTYDISSIADGKPTVYVRWTMGTTDGSIVYSGWNIDDVVIDGDVTAGGAGVVRTESGGSTAVEEGGVTDTYTLALATQPTANVTVSIAPDSQLGVSPTSLTFTTSNWATPQTVTVTAVNDALNEFGHSGAINHSATSADANYNAIPIDGFPVQITDNDNTAPAVNAGPNQTVNLVGAVNASILVNLNGTVSDANGDPFTTTWSVVSGPASVAFGDASAIDTTATFTMQGVYTLRLSASDPGATTSADVVITVNPPLPTYTLTYAGNNSTGGTAPVDGNSPYTVGSTVTVLGNTGTLVRDGYTFNNWNTATNGSGAVYIPGATFTITGNTTLYAQWTPLTYAVTFDKQSGSGGSDGVTATSGVTMPAATPPTRVNYTFGGYYTQISGGIQYYNAAMASTRNWDIAANAILYANWIPNTYTVTFDKQGGTLGSNSVTASYGAAMPAATAPIQDGCVFGGYYTQISGGGTQYYSATMASMANWTLTANTTLYAKWTTGTDGAWIKTTAGPFDWGTSGNWSGGTIANGAGKTASFTPNITATQVVNLESPRTIGNITFTDSTTSSHNLTISGANVLTLAQSSATPTINVTQSGRTLTISSQISGGNGLKKDGAGQLTLSGTNDFTGGISLNDGTLATSANANFGGSANGLTVTGTSTWHAGASVTVYSRSLTVNNGATLTLASGNASKAITGVLSGSGAIINSATTTFEFTNTGNTFTGTVNNGYETKFSSLGDSANPINLVGSNSLFTWQGGSKTFALRPFTLNAAGTGNINNKGGGVLTIQQALAFSGAAGARTLSLQGDNGGANTFSGIIANYDTSVVSLTKSGTCTWVLSGTNSYTGTTTVSVGKLFINGDQSLATGDVSVTGTSATLGGTGIIGGNTSIATNGRLEFNISSTTASFNKLELAAGKTLAFVGASKLYITSSGGAQTGDYILLTAPGGISGVAPATLTLPSGWEATALIIGNDLVLRITSLGPNTVDHFAISSIASPQTVGIPITGITLTAQNAGNQTATSFNGTVTFEGTAGITGTSASFVNGVLSGLSVTPTLTGVSRSFKVNDGALHTGIVYFTVQTRYDSWSGGGFTNAFYDTASASNPDGDSLTNLQEFAFGSDPTHPGQQSLDFVMDGEVTTPGLPVILNFSATVTPDYRAVFARRKDYQTAGLVYGVDFTADLQLWTSSATAPTRLTHANSAGDMEAVSVPFPETVPLSGGGSAAPKFFRVSVQ